MLGGASDVSDADRIAALETRFTESLGAMERRVEDAIDDMRTTLNRVMGGIATRTTDLEKGQKALQTAVAAHEQRLANGDLLLKEFREFRVDFEAWANTSARMFRSRGPSTTEG